MLVSIFFLESTITIVATIQPVNKCVIRIGTNKVVVHLYLEGK